MRSIEPHVRPRPRGGSVSISIQFLGAAGCVTGSQFLVSVGDKRGARRLRHVPGLPARDRAKPDAVRLRGRGIGCGDPDPRPPRPLRPDPGARQGGLQGTDPCDPRHGGPADIVLRDSAKLQGEFTAAGTVARLARRSRPQRPHQPRPRPRRSLGRSTTSRCRRDSATRHRKARPRRGRRCTTSTTSRSPCSSSGGPTTTPRSP